jgi:hypothetical protein
MIKYRKTNHPKWKWELEEDYSFWLKSSMYPSEYDNIDFVKLDFIIINDFCELILKKNYAINGVNLLPDRKVWMRAAFVHDALWQLIELGKLPKSMARVADRIFRDIVAEDDNKFNAWLMWLGVRIGAKWRFGIRY